MRIPRTRMAENPAEIHENSGGKPVEIPPTDSTESGPFGGRKNTDTLTAAGWKPLPDRRWLSPLTDRPYQERVALLLANLPPGMKLASSMTGYSTDPRRRGSHRP